MSEFSEIGHSVHQSLKEIPDRILDVATGALAQANHHAVFTDPYMGYWGNMSVLNAALAGELFLKAIIAKEHPLLIFRDLFHLDEPGSAELDLDSIIKNGRTYNFEHLPKLLWVTTGERIPDLKNFEYLRGLRNSIQHFCAPGAGGGGAALEFIYKNIDPLINKHFGLFAIEYHEDISIGYDYVVGSLIGQELLFSIPDDFKVSEIDLEEELSKASAGYREAFLDRLAAKGLR
jgi:hypothetical protein